MIQIKNNIEELKSSTIKTSLLFCDNAAIYSLMQQFTLKLEQIEKLIELDNEENFTEVANAVKEMYNIDKNLTHIYVRFQVRKQDNEKKVGVIDAKLYL